jgi:GT2 family glycosyltransferase
VHATEGRGPSHARNVGVRAARAETIVCCDADDVVGPGWLSALATALRDHEIVAGVLEVDSLNAPDVVAARGASVPGSAGDFYGVTFPHGCSMGFRRRTYLDVGGLDEHLRAGEEIDLALRLAARSVRVHEVRDAVVHYRFRHDETQQWNQAFEGGRVKPHLCRSARRLGLARPGRFDGLRNWLWLVRTWPRRHDPVVGRRRKWVLASRCGQLAGCWQHKTVYL